jgi:dihydrodipicolinate synthase/N-acetylneuraminate lyase
MTGSSHSSESRRGLQAQLLPKGLPSLWCPLLTHYRPDGAVDEDRFLAHLDHVAAWVTGILVPGSTGDGWELTEAERLRVLGLVLDQATRLRLRVLIGVLKPDTASMMASLVGTVEWLKHRSGETDTLRCLTRRRVAAFAICLPSGPDGSQAASYHGLATLLETGLPLAICHSRHTNGDTVQPETLHKLAERYPNLVLFQDSSGEDLLARAQPQPSGLLFVRGAEGDYVRSLRAGGGPYHGLLLSSANGFARELNHMARDLQRRRVSDAGALSDRLTAAVRDIFDCVDGQFLQGSRFANAAKAIDHFMAFGPRGTQVAPPPLHGGRLLPPEVLRRTADSLRSHSLMPEKGYLD